MDEDYYTILYETMWFERPSTGSSLGIRTPKPMTAEEIVEFGQQEETRLQGFKFCREMFP